MSMKTLAARIQYSGGNQLERLKKQKLFSLQAALRNDYNTRMIKTPYKSVWPCLINTNNLKSDYDKKYISVEFDSQLKEGDTFEILDDGTHWMIYLPILTETAYLRAEIIRCRYTLEIDGETYWIYFQGPTETDLRWYQKNSIEYNILNLSGTIYIKNTPATKKFFKRFTRIKIDGHIWEVQVTDSITVPGIIELEVQEYYDNPIAELPEIHKEFVDNAETIIGQTVVKPNTTVGYEIIPTLYNPENIWKVTGNPRVKVQEIMSDGRICKVFINPGTIGTYTLHYGDHSIECTVDWEQSLIRGPELVYPYEIHTYFLEDAKGTFFLESDVAKIIEQGDDYCKVEITTGKKGKFLLQCEIYEHNYDDEIMLLSDDIQIDEDIDDDIDPDMNVEIVSLIVTIGSL